MKSPAFTPGRVLVLITVAFIALVMALLLSYQRKEVGTADTDVAPAVEAPVVPADPAAADTERNVAAGKSGNTPVRQPGSKSTTQADAKTGTAEILEPHGAASGESGGEPGIPSAKKTTEKAGAGSVTKLKTESGTKYIISLLDEPAGAAGGKSGARADREPADAFASDAATPVPGVRGGDLQLSPGARGSSSIVEVAGADAPVGGNKSLATPVLKLEPVSTKTFRFSWTDISGESEYRLWERRNRASGYRQVASLPANAVSHDLEVFLPRRVNARYMLQACNGGGCTNSAALKVGGGLAEAVGYVKASNTGSEDRFGHAVAISGDGNTLAVGAPWQGIGSKGDRAGRPAAGGGVYIFVRKEGNWIQQSYLQASSMRLGDHFGWSISLSNDGDTLAVGAIGEDAVANGLNGHRYEKTRASGEVYVYVRNADAWRQQAHVQASNSGLLAAGAADSFGISVSLSGDGNTLVVGADGEDGDTVRNDDEAGNSGAAYIFVRRGGNWNRQARVKASNIEAGDHFGWAVSLSNDGNMLAVGAIGEDSVATGVNGNQRDNAATNSGAVYVYRRSGGNWKQQAYVKASNTRPGDLVTADEFGWSVALSGDGATLAVGARFEDSKASGVNGNQQASSGHSSGAVYVYTRSGVNWSQQAYVKASNTGWGDEFGAAVALSGNGNTLAVGAVGEDSGASGIDGDQHNDMLRSPGAAYVYTRSDGNWFQQAYVKASNTGQAPRSPQNAFGFALALSDGGDVLAVGAPEEDSAATGVNRYLNDSFADSSGAVYLY
jgi:hypothetical protein